jgi:hypothetical protein
MLRRAQKKNHRSPLKITDRIAGDGDRSILGGNETLDPGIPEQLDLDGARSIGVREKPKSIRQSGVVAPTMLGSPSRRIASLSEKVSGVATGSIENVRVWMSAGFGAAAAQGDESQA